ncbi:hypothetical protein J3D48_004766 [Pseudomonas fluorescens]|uniref:hypothetical protein n=1 Tax=Pseudomonas fluorescens TaxID=294 RepID=UPI0020A0D810|nr:hypothetical protein [Pseudomonas fluorescens]MCP1488453.1 hypothetical protein [Pseudomonas fluorescens]
MSASKYQSWLPVRWALFRFAFAESVVETGEHKPLIDSIKPGQRQPDQSDGREDLSDGYSRISLHRSGLPAEYSLRPVIPEFRPVSEREAMNFRTITVLNTEGEPLNAVLLCCFSATGIEKRFGVYSLNEVLDGDLIRIYVASICTDQHALVMTSVSAEDFNVAAQTLKSILSDALAPVPDSPDGSYRIINCPETAIIPGYVRTHRTLKINEAWVEKLLKFNPSTEKTDQTHTSTRKVEDHIDLGFTDYHSIQTFTSPAAMTLTVTNSGEIMPLTQPETSHIEESLTRLMVNLGSHKDTLLSRHEQLYNVKLEQERKDRYLTKREAILNQREDKLKKSAASLTIAEAQMNEMIKLIDDASSAFDASEIRD